MFFQPVPSPLAQSTYIHDLSRLLSFFLKIFFPIWSLKDGSHKERQQRDASCRQPDGDRACTMNTQQACPVYGLPELFPSATQRDLEASHEGDGDLRNVHWHEVQHNSPGHMTSWTHPWDGPENTRRMKTVKQALYFSYLRSCHLSQKSVQIKIIAD